MLNSVNILDFHTAPAYLIRMASEREARSEDAALLVLDKIPQLQEEPQSGSIEELYTQKFRELVDTAVEELRWLMENSGDDKDKIKICQDILDHECWNCSWKSLWRGRLPTPCCDSLPLGK